MVFAYSSLIQWSTQCIPPHTKYSTHRELLVPRQRCAWSRKPRPIATREHRDKHPSQPSLPPAPTPSLHPCACTLTVATVGEEVHHDVPRRDLGLIAASNADHARGEKHLPPKASMHGPNGCTHATTTTTQQQQQQHTHTTQKMHSRQRPPRCSWTGE
jgi:hypothetical protein